ncbi:hypothetical protein HUU59_10990 [bacterium]|nr:hypothetical protein [bacterium]
MSDVLIVMFGLSILAVLFAGALSVVLFIVDGVLSVARWIQNMKRAMR